MTCDRRLLMISSVFPPTGGSGVQRTVKFAKYLSRFGWRPIVWAADAIDELPRDETLLADLPEDVSVHRQPLNGVYHTTRKALARLRNCNGLTGKLGEAMNWRLEARLARIGSPDRFINWAKAGVDPLCRLIESEGIDAIYSTFSPASNHWLGLALKQRTQLPWIADFRDLWTDEHRYVEPVGHTSAQSRRSIDEALQQTILETADAVIGVSPSQTAILSRYVPLERHKFVTITNGFDPHDFPAFNSEPPAFATIRPDAKPATTSHVPPTTRRTSRRGVFVLSHVGRFDQWRTPSSWFAGLERFVRYVGDPSTRRDFQFRVVGHANETTRRRLQDTGARCVFTGYVSHVQAVAEMCSADALLLSVPDGRNAESVIPAKLFEYLASGRPVLVVGPRGGECETIVRDAQAGLTACLDEQAIAGALCELYDAWRLDEPLLGCPFETLEPFSRVELTKRLASLLDGLVTRRLTKSKVNGRQSNQRRVVQAGGGVTGRAPDALVAPTLDRLS